MTQYQHICNCADCEGFRFRRGLKYGAAISIALWAVIALLVGAL